MKVEESCNDNHLVYIQVSNADIKALKNGLLANIECEKSDTQIIIELKEKGNE